MSQVVNFTAIDPSEDGFWAMDDDEKYLLSLEAYRDLEALIDKDYPDLGLYTWVKADNHNLLKYFIYLEKNGINFDRIRKEACINNKDIYIYMTQ